MSEANGTGFLPVRRPSAAAASVLAIGLMSGTSQDGVDVALIDTDGETDRAIRRHRLPALYQGRAHAAAPATAAAANLTERTARPAIVAKAERW